MLKKRILLLILFLTLFTLGGCKPDDPVTTDFTVSGLDQENKEDDDVLEYFNKAYHLMDLMTSHEKYSTSVMSEWNTLRMQYYTYGISKEDYTIPSESVLQKASNASRITNLLNGLYFVSYDFVEGEPFTYLDYTITTYANDDFIYYYQEDTDGFIKEFAIEVTDDNAKYIYYETSETQTLYQRNDFDKGNLYVNILELEDSIRYGYSFYNYQTDIEETIYYADSSNSTLEYYISDYQNGEIITYIVDQERDIIGAYLLDQGIKDLYVEATITSSEATYEIGFNALNIDGWDLYRDNYLYENDIQVYDDYIVSNNIFNNGILLNTTLTDFREELYNNKADIYTGPYTFLDLEDLYNDATELSNVYDIDVTGETITITLNGTTYTPQELRTLFLNYIPY